MDRAHRQQVLGAILVATVVGLVAGAVLVPVETVLVVDDVETGERYLAESVSDGSTVGLEYAHSVERSRVYDEYRVADRTLVNTRMEFESYGWGLPAKVDVTKDNGTFVYEPAQPIAELRTLSVSPGRIAGHTLIVDGERHDLVGLTNANDVRIHVDRRSLLEGYL